VSIPPSQVVFPREKPAPKEKEMTRWEKFRLEKGMPARKKRGRMVFDEITNDWVPRHGMGSIKKIADKH
jgi:regulator of ribosome biosynthesis